MPDSAPSQIVSAQSPARPVPEAPTINTITFNKLQATVIVAMPTVDIAGEPLGNLTNIKIFYGPAGALNQDSPAEEFPGSYTPGSVQSVQVEVPAWGTMYDFEAEVSD